MQWGLSSQTSHPGTKIMLKHFFFTVVRLPNPTMSLAPELHSANMTFLCFIS